jgi:hypothetical protein
MSRSKRLSSLYEETEREEDAIILFPFVGMDSRIARVPNSPSQTDTMQSNNSSRVILVFTASGRHRERESYSFVVFVDRVFQSSFLPSMHPDTRPLPSKIQIMDWIRRVLLG